METYAALSIGHPPSPTVERAVVLCKRREHALDLGAGSLRNTSYLVQAGFHVDAVDKDPVMLTAAKKINSIKLSTAQVSYSDFSFVKGKYDLVVAVNSLPFASPEEFPELWRKILGSLAPEGVFCGTFFGPTDTWAATHKNMTFNSKQEVESLLQSLRVIELIEREFDGSDIRGNQKHWHILEVMAVHT